MKEKRPTPNNPSTVTVEKPGQATRPGKGKKKKGKGKDQGLRLRKEKELGHRP